MAIVKARAQARGEAAVAVLVPGSGANPQVAWVSGALDIEPLFLTYSISKTFLAVLLLVLRDEGRLSLEDPLSRWFPTIQQAEQISLRMLLRHSAGIPDYGPLAAYHQAVRTSPSAPWSFERFAAETYEKGLRYDPGEGWEYSNPGYMLLKRVAELTSETSFAQLVARKVAAPLGLQKTFVAESLKDLASLAPAQSLLLSEDRSPRDVRGQYHPGWVAHGVVASSPSEVVRIYDALFAGRIVQPAAVEEMKALLPVPAPPTPRWRKPGYGLGLMGNPASPWGPLWGHNGGGPGYQASAFYVPALGGATVCAMTAFEGEPSAEDIVFEVFANLAS
jgi:D-alanyl-D-alanine carboxypeptidase